MNVNDFSKVKKSPIYTNKVDSRIITSIEEYIKLQKQQITTNLPEDVLLDADLIEEELIFEN